MRLFVLVFIFTISLLAHELQFEHELSTALKKAKKQNKEVMMMYSAVWCPECSYMKDVVFKDKKVFNYIQKHFVILTLDIQKDKLPKGFDYVGIPTFFFIDKNAKLNNRIIGGKKAEKFLNELKALK